MKWLTKWGYAPKCVRHIEKYQNGILDLFDIGYMPRRGYHSGTKLWENMGLGRAGEGFPGRQALGLHRLFGRQPVRHEYSLSRDWLAQLWVADKRADRIKQKCQRGGLQNVGGEERAVLGNANGSWSPFLKQFKPFVNITVQDIDELLGSRFGGDSVPPTSPEEVKLAPLLARSDLLITRDIEWANLMFAFEQENRYKVVDPYHPRFPVGSIHEQSNIIFRQLLRTRRPFVAYVVDADGNEIFQIRRPFWWINSTIYAEVDGKEIGVVHRRWHLWRRIYDLYLGKKQFAVVENPGFWNWTFTLKDEDERVLAEINRDWRGFGLELFTDAGQYVIRFGPSKDSMSLEAAIPELEVGRQLTLSERAVAVSLAVSLDCDYFSRHGGWGLPIFIAGE